MFGDSVFDDYDEVPTGQREPSDSLALEEDEDSDGHRPLAYGGLDRRYFGKEAIAQMLREAGGC